MGNQQGKFMCLDRVCDCMDIDDRSPKRRHVGPAVKREKPKETPGNVKYLAKEQQQLLGIQRKESIDSF